MTEKDSRPLAKSDGSPQLPDGDGLPTDDRLPNSNPLPTGGITTIGLRTYLTAFVVLIILMIAAYVLTFALPAGEFNRSLTDGVEEIVPGSYHSVPGGLALWQWLLSPLLILGGPNGTVLILLIVFLFVIGGSFYALEKCGVLPYLIARVAQRFEHNNRVLLFVMPLVFMLLGSFIGSFEETIPLAAIVVALALRLGWDRLQGLGMSLLAVGCGFAVGIMNPFTVGIAQSIAGLPMFSGVSLRIFSFVVVYAYLMTFLLLNARKCERQRKTGASAVAPPDSTTVDKRDGSVLSTAATALPVAPATANPKMARALRAFVAILVCGIVLIIGCSVVPIEGLSNLVFPVTALTFLLCGVVATPLSGASGRELGRWFLGGMRAIAPGALLVLMASSISYMLTEGKVLDTIIYYAGNFLANKPAWLAIIGIYLLVLVLEFAIASGSAKAFLLMPLLAPLVDLIDIPRQLAVVAYAFGDGFTNVFYPTNPALLIALSICGFSYGQWIRRTWKFLLGLLLITSTILVVGLVIGYA
ncbi:MAG: AbgT family transporter [Coriobacteriales bacterium]|jgi:uncharacterized ion transporter superfamily protein YfcC|nr:AbgT family transporter [Coriobacteriales bacterium]